VVLAKNLKKNSLTFSKNFAIIYIENEREREEINMKKEIQFLVQRIVDIDLDGEDRFSSLMTLSELVHYIDMQDICTESYDIWEVTEFGKLTHLNYVGWQPGCLIEFATDDGTVVHSGYGVDH
jgi:hypothetical protein